MLPRQYRLTYDRDFRTLQAEGRFVGGALVTAKVWKIDPAKYPRRAYTPHDLRIAFVTPIKVSKRAVERNRLKRQMREVVRQILKQERLRRGYLLLLIAKREMLGQSYAEIEKSMIDVLSRAHLIV